MNETQTTPQVTPCGLELADRLEHLLQLPLDRADHIEQWYAASGELTDWIDAHFTELSHGVPHHLSHYFSDADIRAKEPGYRTNQEDAVRLYIRQLRGEPLPERKRAWWCFW
jgi:hypothetical protein